MWFIDGLGLRRGLYGAGFRAWLVKGGAANFIISKNE